MHINWFWILLAILVIVAVTLGGLACSSATFSPFAQKWDEVYTGSFTAGAVDLNLTTGNGSMTYRTWSGPGYKLVVHMRALGMSEARARRLAAELIRVEHGEGSIKVDGDGGWFPKAMADVELYLPAGPEYHLQANTGNGSVKLEGGSYASARLHTGNGSVKLEGGSYATARVQTGNGSLESTAVIGELEVKTGNGSVKLEGGSYATARVQTGNGSLESTAVIGELEANAGNGSIRIAAAGSGSWTLATRNGSISVDTANLGETGIMVDADTTQGKIVMDIGGHRVEQQGGRGTPLRMSTSGYEQARRQLSIRARTGLGKITVLPGA